MPPTTKMKPIPAPRDNPVYAAAEDKLLKLQQRCDELTRERGIAAAPYPLHEPTLDELAEALLDGRTIPGPPPRPETRPVEMIDKDLAIAERAVELQRGIVESEYRTAAMAVLDTPAEELHRLGDAFASALQTLFDIGQKANDLHAALVRAGYRQPLGLAQAFPHAVDDQVASLSWEPVNLKSHTSEAAFVLNRLAGLGLVEPNHGALVALRRYEKS